MKKRNQKAISLIELVISMTMASVLMLAGGVLLLGSNRAFRQVYASIHDPVQADAKVLASAFGTVVRKSNRTNYKVYEVTEDSFVEATPESGESVAVGQAVELRYWNRPFYELSGDMEQMDIDDTGSHYALFYLEDETIYVDYGEVVDGVGGVNGGLRQTTDIVTQTLAENVDISDNVDIFSHEIIGGAGNGCISLNVTLINDEGDSVDVKMAALLRVLWPQ